MLGVSYINQQTYQTTFELNKINKSLEAPDL